MISHQMTDASDVGAFTGFTEWLLVSTAALLVLSVPAALGW